SKILKKNNVQRGAIYFGSRGFSSCFLGLMDLSKTSWWLKSMIAKDLHFMVGREGWKERGQDKMRPITSCSNNLLFPASSTF
ncbi:hypothetical protein ACQP3C_27920, partial [Escherichia coli]